MALGGVDLPYSAGQRTYSTLTVVLAALPTPTLKQSKLLATSSMSSVTSITYIRFFELVVSVVNVFDDTAKSDSASPAPASMFRRAVVKARALPEPFETFTA